MTWSPDDLFKKLSDVCFIDSHLDRASFSTVLEIIKNELSPDEIMCYDQMKEIYQSTRKDNYLGYCKRKTTTT